MNIVGRLGAVAGMDDVRDKPDIMAQARDLGANLARAQKK
jgi:adenosylmethionine-8-amino-7-oxononanoate aminotransferase